MATYAIGDIQGCYQTLRQLLERLAYNPRADRLWLVGDLVNRGPRSLDVLRWAADHDHRVTTVLGNHDLGLLAVAAGIRRAKRSDTLDDVLGAPDCDDLLTWLARRPLLHHEGGFILVHAGLLPRWSLFEAERRARAAEAWLQHDREGMLRAYFSAKDARRWDETLEESRRTAVAVHLLTRMRICTADGELELGYAGPPRGLPSGYRPWFAWPVAATMPHGSGEPRRVLCGHWAALGLHVAPELIALDTGCVYGGTLTAYRLEDGAIFQQPLADRHP